jgi:ribosomal-protein-serine acetyltransferase
MIPRTTTLSDGVVTLRPTKLEDAPHIVEAVKESVAEIKPWMSWCHPDYNENEAHAWLATHPAAWEAGTQFAFVITDAQQGTFLGGTGLNHINYFYRLANVGYWVRTSATGRGIATRAARLVARFGVEQVGLLRAEIVVAVGNQASQRVAEKAGAKCEGVLRNRLIVGDNILNAFMYSLTPQDFSLGHPKSKVKP